MTASTTLCADGDFYARGNLFGRDPQSRTFASLTICRGRKNVFSDVHFHTTDPAELEQIAATATNLARALKAELAAEKAADQVRAEAEVAQVAIAYADGI